MKELKQPRYAWTQLYEARKAQRLPLDERPSQAGRGRPERVIPVKKSTLYLSAGDEAALKKWQQTFTGMLGRKPSTGETAGILAKICSERFAAISQPEGEVESLDTLVALLVGVSSTEMFK